MLKKYPIPANEQQRLNALLDYEILDSLSEEEFDRITELASLICDVPISLVSLIDESRQWFKSKTGLDVNEAPRETAFCQYTIMNEGLFEVEDALKDERFEDSDLVTGDPNMRFYAGYPLINPEGFALGALCVIDRKPRILTENQKAALRLLSREVVSLIIERRQKEELRNFEKLFETSNDLLFIGSNDGFFKKVNPAFEKVLGWSKKDLLSTSSFEYIHPEDIERSKEQLQGLAKGQKTVNFIQRFKTAGGSYKSIQWTSTPEVSTGKIFGIGRDVTEKIILEQDLRRTKEVLEQINNAARVGGWEVDVPQRKIYWTSITKEIHSVRPDYDPGLQESISFCKEGESRDKIVQAVKTAITEGKAWDIELQIVDANGKEIWVRSLGHAEFENGQCKRVVGTLQDIDEKKKAELEVNAAKKLLDDVLNAASEVSIIATDINGLITVFNTGAERLLGYSADEMIGKQTPEIIHDQDDLLKRSKQLTQEFGHPVNGFEILVKKPEIEGSEQTEATYVKKNGEKRIVSLVVTAIKDDKNRTTGYLGVARDITERRKVEVALIKEKALLSAFVEHAPAAVAMFDKNMNYLAVSNNWLKDYRLEGKDVIGKSHYDLFPYISNEERKRHQRVLNGAIERKEEDIYLIPGREEPEYETWEVRPWLEFDGSVGGIMIFTKNITSIIKQREELKIAKQQAEQASVTKSEFLANMSHEIRTPLNGVIGFTDLVLKTQLNETQQQYLTIVNQSANSLLTIINDILDFSKIEAGKLELDIEKCDIHDLGSQAADVITYQTQSKGIEMLLNISPGLPRFIWADSARLKQVLINLLGNASKFTERGEIELKIEALFSVANQTTMRFSVRDTGIGIKPDKQEKIFEAFSQEDSSTTKKYGGTGLGLSISNKLLGLMGSKLQLQSAPGAGSTFYFDLTLRTEQGKAVSKKNIEQIKKVLIVDDNENNRLILKQMLLPRNIQLVESKNGLEALQILSTGEKFDAILMDFQMPFMDGLETVKKIRESVDDESNENSILLLHSSADDERIIKASEELKINRRLTKPIKVQDIYGALSTLHKKGELSSDDSLQSDAAGIESTKNAIQVLIVEDNPVNMLLAKTIIKRIAPNSLIKEAKNGQEGIEIFKANALDFVLMDVQMPEMNGYEATKKIRETERDGHVPIIALTAGNVKSERERCIEAGMDDFIIKPIVEETIKMVFDKWLPGDEKNKGAEVVINQVDNPAVHFDSEKLWTLFGSDEIYNELVNLAKIELESSLTNLEIAVTDKDIKRIKAIGHKLYGTAGTANFYLLAKIARNLEALNSFDEEEINKLLTEAKNEIELLMKLLN